MNKAKIYLAVSVIILFALGAGFIGAIHAEGQDSDIAGKLDQIIANQKTIMQSIDAIKEELYIIKIRVTQR